MLDFLCPDKISYTAQKTPATLFHVLKSTPAKGSNFP